MDMKKLRFVNFLEAVWTLYRQRGGKLASRELILQRASICEMCTPHFTGKGCTLCGCCVNQKETLFNKLAHEDQHCPLEKW